MALVIPNKSAAVILSIELNYIILKQAENSNLVYDMCHQGATIPDYYNLFYKCITILEDPAVMCGMPDGNAWVQLLHCLSNYAAPR